MQAARGGTKMLNGLPVKSSAKLCMRRHHASCCLRQSTIRWKRCAAMRSPDAPPRNAKRLSAPVALLHFCATFAESTPASRNARKELFGEECQPTARANPRGPQPCLHATNLTQRLLASPKQGNTRKQTAALPKRGGRPLRRARTCTCVSSALTLHSLSAWHAATSPEACGHAQTPPLDGSGSAAPKYVSLSSKVLEF